MIFTLAPFLSFIKGNAADDTGRRPPPFGSVICPRLPPGNGNFVLAFAAFLFGAAAPFGGADNVAVLNPDDFDLRLNKEFVHWFFLSFNGLHVREPAHAGFLPTWTLV